MGDPTGSMGLGGVHALPADLDAAFKGGGNFMTRLQELSDATERHDAAFNKLQIGNSAVAARREAESALAAAELTKAEAARVLADAERIKAEAARMRQDAEAVRQLAVQDSQRIVAEANEKRAALESAIERYTTATHDAMEAKARGDRAEAKYTGLLDELRRRLAEFAAE